METRSKKKGSGQQQDTSKKPTTRRERPSTGTKRNKSNPPASERPSRRVKSSAGAEPEQPNAAEPRDGVGAGADEGPAPDAFKAEAGPSAAPAEDLVAPNQSLRRSAADMPTAAPDGAPKEEQVGSVAILSAFPRVLRIKAHLCEGVTSDSSRV